jgi:tetratricopeptide (TPR) repeat protein
MLGKITGALIRKEADAYRAMGLHEEALALFKKSLNSTPPLPPDVKNAIEEQIQQLEAEVNGADIEACEQLSDDQIAIIKAGWGGDASVEDLAVSADALNVLGCHRNALEEFGILIERGYSPHRMIGVMANCLARLNPPAELLEAVDRLSARLSQDPKAKFALKLSLAEEMFKSQFIAHALELSRDLIQNKNISSGYKIRLEGLIKQLKSSLRKTHPPPANGAPPAEAASASSSVVQRICAAVKALTSRMRSPKTGP